MPNTQLCQVLLASRSITSGFPTTHATTQFRRHPGLIWDQPGSNHQKSPSPQWVWDDRKPFRTYSERRGCLRRTRQDFLELLWTFSEIVLIHHQHFHQHTHGLPGTSKRPLRCPHLRVLSLSMAPSTFLQLNGNQNRTPQKGWVGPLLLQSPFMTPAAGILSSYR